MAKKKTEEKSATKEGDKIVEAVQRKTKNTKKKKRKSKKVNVLDNVDLQKELQIMKDLINDEDFQIDVLKFVKYTNKSSGKRIRESLLIIKEKSFMLRKHIQHKKNSMKKKPKIK